MKPRQVVGTVLSVVATVALVWGIRGMVATPDCGDFGQVACPSTLFPNLAAIIGGAILLIVALVLAPAGMLIAIAVGGVGGLVDGLVNNDNDYIGIGIVFLGVGALLLLIGFLANRAGERKKARIARITGHGLAAEGVIVEVRDTGVTVNEDPRVTLVIDYRRSDGAMTRVEHTMAAPRLRPPRPGGFVTVHYEPTGTDVIVDVPEQAAAPAFEPSAIGLAAELERLAVLHRAGTLTDTEFSTAKRRLLGTG